jgi:hypothetical protein
LTHVLPDGRFAISTHEPRIHHLELRNCDLGPARLTPTRRFRLEPGVGAGRLEDEWFVRCPGCAAPFPVDDPTLELETACPRCATVVVVSSCAD